ncbi:MAG: MFS transporter [Gammaproteobacteria bacterium]|nr:MFS transporter [Gammaproteobacteria bacterium]
MKYNKRVLTLGWGICLLGALFYCYEYLLRIEPSIMVPQLMHQFHATAAVLGVLAAFYYYAYTPMQLLVGMLIDTFGVRVIITVAVLLCATGSLIFSTAHLIYFAAIGRFLIGFGSAFAFVAVLKLAAVWLPKHHFALFTGFATALGMLGAMVGDVELTHLVRTIGWKLTLNVGTVLGFVLVPIIWLVVRNKPRTNAQNDVAVNANYKETILGLWEIIKNPQMWIIGLIGCMLYLSLTVVAEMWGIPFLKSVYHLNADLAASSCAMVFAGWLIGAPINGWLSDATGSRRLPLFLGGIFAAATIAFIIFDSSYLSVDSVRALLFMFGFFSSVEIVCFALGRENNPTRVAATAVSFTNLLIMLGGMVFQPLLGEILDVTWRGRFVGGVRVYSAHNFEIAFYFIPIALLFGAFLSFFLKEPLERQILDEFD